MSIKRIIKNIEKNIQGRYGAEEVLLALECITRMPCTFKTMVNAGTFFYTRHNRDEDCDEDCDDCYSQAGFVLKCRKELETASSVIFSRIPEIDEEKTDECGCSGAGTLSCVYCKSELCNECVYCDDNQSYCCKPCYDNEKLPKHPKMGFKTPILLSENLTGFLREANLGPSDPLSSYLDSVPMNEILLSTKKGISTRSILTPLFNIYAYINKMQKDPDNKQFLTATPLMHKWFGKTFTELQNRPSTKNKQGKDIKFDPESFRYATIQSILALNFINTRTLTEEQENSLYDPWVLDHLKEDQLLVTGALGLYREKLKKNKN